MLPLKLILGRLAFSELIFRPNKHPTPVKSILENTMGYPFFDFFLNIDLNISDYLTTGCHEL